MTTIAVLGSFNADLLMRAGRRPAADETVPGEFALYLGGSLKLEELITRRYKVDEAPQAFADLQSGRNARGVVVF